MAEGNMWLLKFKNRILKPEWHESDELPDLIRPVYEKYKASPKRGGDTSEKNEV